MTPTPPTAMGALEITQEGDRVVVSERRARALGRALLHSALATGAFIVVIRLYYLAAASAALWALPGSGALVVLVFACGRAGSAALDRQRVEVIGDTLITSNARWRKRSIVAVRVEHDSLRVICVGGARQIHLFQDFPSRDLEMAALALRAALDVPDHDGRQLPANAFRTHRASPSCVDVAAILTVSHLVGAPAIKGATKYLRVLAGQKTFQFLVRGREERLDELGRDHRYRSSKHFYSRSRGRSRSRSPTYTRGRIRSSSRSPIRNRDRRTDNRFDDDCHDHHRRERHSQDWHRSRSHERDPDERAYREPHHDPCARDDRLAHRDSERYRSRSRERSPNARERHKPERRVPERRDFDRYEPRDRDERPARDELPAHARIDHSQNSTDGGYEHWDASAQRASKPLWQQDEELARSGIHETPAQRRDRMRRNAHHPPVWGRSPSPPHRMEDRLEIGADDRIRKERKRRRKQERQARRDAKRSRRAARAHSGDAKTLSVSAAPAKTPDKAVLPSTAKPPVAVAPAREASSSESDGDMLGPCAAADAAS
eukprot:IDg12634t1